MQILPNSTGAVKFTDGKRCQVVLTFYFNEVLVFTLVAMHVHHSSKYKHADLKNLHSVLAEIRSCDEGAPVRTVIVMCDFNTNMHLPFGETHKVQSIVGKVSIFFHNVYYIDTSFVLLNFGWVN